MNKTNLEIVKMIVDSDLPISTKNAIVTHYLLPRPGHTLSPVEMEEGKVGSVDRPTAEEIAIEKDPIAKAEFKDTGKLMDKAEKK